MEITVRTSWQSLNFANSYTDAVAFALAPSLNEVDSAATRCRNIDATGGEIKLQETKLMIDPAAGLQVPNTSGHVDETVTLLALERGLHTLESGTVIRVGEINTSKLYVKGFETIAFSSGFTGTPPIVRQVQTYNGNGFIISRQRAPSTDGFQPTMQEEQADNLNHAAETAVLTRSQTGHDAAFVKTRMQTVDGAGFSVALAEDEASSWGAHAVDSVGWIAVDIATAHDADGFVFEAGTLRARDGAVGTALDADMADAGAVAGVARLGALGAQGVGVQLEEDLSLNPETSHRAEDIARLAWDGASEIWGAALVGPAAPAGRDP